MCSKQQRHNSHVAFGIVWGKCQFKCICIIFFVCSIVNPNKWYHYEERQHRQWCWRTHAITKIQLILKIQNLFVFPFYLLGWIFAFATSKFLNPTFVGQPWKISPQKCRKIQEEWRSVQGVEQFWKIFLWNFA